MTWLGGLSMIGAVAVTACGNGEATTSTTGAGGTGGTAGTGGQATTTSASVGTGGTGGSVAALVNGCDPAKAEDHTGDGTAMVMFPEGGPKYAPACMKIKVNDSVMFMGDLSSHPLRAGQITAGMPVPDTMSPILSKDSGMMATFKFPKAGTYGYYSTVDQSSMVGAVVVE
jgi:plastocyanin